MVDLKKLFTDFLKERKLLPSLKPKRKVAYKDLKPIDYNPKIISSFDKKIQTFLYELLFSNLNDVLKNYNTFINDVANSENDIVRAIEEGKITYSQGKFKSNFKDNKFPIGLSKYLTEEVGATFNKTTKSFVIPQEKLSKDIQGAINKSIFDNVYFTTQLLGAIAKSSDQTFFDELFAKAGFENEYENVIKDTFKQIKQNDVEIPIELNEEQNKVVAKDYTDNLKLTIKDFTDKQTLELRKLVEENTKAGFRPEFLASKIQERFNVSKNKAKFLADQETRLLTTQYAKAKFTEGGIITKFRWGSSASKVQDEFHAQYYDKIFDFDNLPVINEDTNETGLPGERYNCKCRIIPVVEELA